MVLTSDTKSMKLIMSASMSASYELFELTVHRTCIPTYRMFQKNAQSNFANVSHSHGSSSK